jgi:hypothetical protein
MVTETRCAQSKQTNRISQITASGEIIHEQICLKEENVSHDRASRPTKVNARFAEGIKPGMFVSVLGGIAIEVWAKPDAPVPSLVFGVAVK